MAKKEYLTPEFTEIITDVKLYNILAGTEWDPDPDPIDDDIAAKEWNSPFNDDEPFNDEP